MRRVATVRGVVDAAQLGRVLMHEHLFVLTYDYMLNYPRQHGFDEEREIANAAHQLDRAGRAGIDTIVDMTVMNMGRFIPRIQRVAERTSVNIVVATGLYTYETLPLPFHFRGPGTMLGGPEPLTDLFVADIVDGIAETGVRAGIIKCATDEAGMTRPVERVVRACARASVLTGAPLSTHTHARGQVGLDQLTIFDEEGVDLARVVIGHSGDTDDIDYLVKLLSTGASIGMDRFGTERLLTTDARVAVIAELCRQGFSGQIVLSHDAAVFNDLSPTGRVSDLAPNWHFSYIPETVLSLLREARVTDAMIDDMLVRNPARILTQKAI